MAKDKDEAPAEGEVPKKKSKLMLLIIVGVVVLTLIVGGGAFMLMKKKPVDEDEEDGGPKSAKTEKKDKKDKKKDAPPAYYKVDKPFTVKLQAEGAENYLQVEIQLKLLDAQVIDQVKAFEPEIKHKVTLLLLGQKVADLNTPQGVQKLSNGIRNTINNIMDRPDPREKKAPAEDDAEPDSPVQAVLFTSFIIQ